MWTIVVKTLADKSLEYKLEPAVPIGTLILNLTSDLPETENWSLYTLYYKERNVWLTNPRMSLAQYELYNGTILEFVKTSIMTYIILPNFRIKEYLVDTCATVLDVLKGVCESVGLRKFEELSFMMISGSDPEQTLKQGQKNKNQKSDTNHFYDAIKKYYEEVEKNIPDPKYEYNVIIPEIMQKIFPKSHLYSDWCPFQENWGFNDTDILYLTLKYSQLAELNPKVDPVRSGFTFCHAAYSIQTQQQKCDESELYDLVSHIWHVQLIRDKLLVEKVEESKASAIDDIDQALKLLEMSTNEDATATQNNSSNDELLELKSVLPTDTAKDGKLTKLSKSHITVHKGARESDPVVTDDIHLIGAAIKPKVKFNKGTYKLVISNVYDKKGKSIKIELPFNTEDDFLIWFANLRAASRSSGTTKLHVENEKVFLKSYLVMRRRLAAPKAEIKSHVGQFLNQGTYGVDDLFPGWIFKHANSSTENVLNKLLDGVPTVCTLSLQESQLAFIQKWKKLYLCNLMPFKVVFDPDFEISNVPKKVKYELLGVTATFVAKINPSNDEIIQKWLFSEIRHWTLNWSSNTQKLNLDNGKVYFIALSCPIKKLHECIGGNIYQNSRKDPSAPFDVSLFSKLTI